MRQKGGMLTFLRHRRRRFARGNTKSKNHPCLQAPPRTCLRRSLSPLCRSGDDLRRSCTPCSPCRSACTNRHPSPLTYTSLAPPGQAGILVIYAASYRANRCHTDKFRQVHACSLFNRNCLFRYKMSLCALLLDSFD